jgi:hypothetical protein
MHGWKIADDRPTLWVLWPPTGFEAYEVEVQDGRNAKGEHEIRSGNGPLARTEEVPGLGFSAFSPSISATLS